MQNVFLTHSDTFQLLGNDYSISFFSSSTPEHSDGYKIDRQVKISIVRPNQPIIKIKTMSHSSTQQDKATR